MNLISQITQVPQAHLMAPCSQKHWESPCCNGSPEEPSWMDQNHLQGPEKCNNMEKHMEGSLEEMGMGRSRDGNNVLHGCGHFKPSAATCSLGSKVKDARARFGSGLQKAEQGEWFLIQP